MSEPATATATNSPILRWQTFIMLILAVSLVVLHAMLWLAFNGQFERYQTNLDNRLATQEEAQDEQLQDYTTLEEFEEQREATNQQFEKIESKLDQLLQDNKEARSDLAND